MREEEVFGGIFGSILTAGKEEALYSLEEGLEDGEVIDDIAGNYSVDVWSGRQ